MKTKLWKAFWDYEKEEKWLNDLAAKGMAMTAYSWCHYTFAECTPGEYIYRIELLEHDVKHPESVLYIHFMEESGVEFIDYYRSWVYFRKKATDGAFEIYSDFDSRIKHYQRVSRLWLVLGCAELCIALSQVSLLINNYKNSIVRLYKNPSLRVSVGYEAIQNSHTVCRIL